MGLQLSMRMAISHAHFEAIHPFSDGNGRIGRMIWPLQMVQAGIAPIYLSGYVEAQKSDYYAVLQAAQKRLDYGPIIVFLADAIARSHEEMEHSRAALIRLGEEWQSSVSARAGSTEQKALTILLSSPLITAGELSARAGVTFAASSRALEKLKEKGVISERTGFKRNRLFAAEDVIAVLSRRFGDDPQDAIEVRRRAISSAP
jgi:Fic family protein